MKVYNKEKTQVLETYDLKKGYLTTSKLNGEVINVYIPYSQKTLILREIAELKNKLDLTDYQSTRDNALITLSQVNLDAVQTASGESVQDIIDRFTNNEKQRQAWRDRINELEGELL